MAAGHSTDLSIYHDYEALPVGVVHIKPDGRVNYLNSEAKALIVNDIEGELWREVVPTIFNPRDDDGCEISLTNGQRVHLFTRAIAEGGQLVVLADLTSSHDFQSKRLQHQRLAIIGQMVAALAHQLRTPLSAAMLYAGNLRHQLADDQNLAKLQQQLGALDQQINDVLLYTRGQKVSIESIQAKRLWQGLNEHISVYKQKFPDVEWSLKPLASSVALYADYQGLLGALTNIVENALQVVSQAQSKHISVQFKVIHGQLTIVIHDSGPGIELSLRNKIFEPFFSLRAGGTGLGLAIVKQVIEAHQGQIWLDNVETGCCFTISIPIIAEKQQSTYHQSSPIRSMA